MITSRLYGPDTGGGGFDVPNVIVGGGITVIDTAAFPENVMPSFARYTNPSGPRYPAVGVYVKEPSGFSVNCPCATLVTSAAVSGSLSASVSFSSTPDAATSSTPFCGALKESAFAVGELFVATVNCALVAVTVGPSVGADARSWYVPGSETFRFENVAMPRASLVADVVPASTPEPEIVMSDICTNAPGSGALCAFRTFTWTAGVIACPAVAFVGCCWNESVLVLLGTTVRGLSAVLSVSVDSATALVESPFAITL